MLIPRIQLFINFFRKIGKLERNVQPALHLTSLSLGIAHFRDKGRLIPPFPPCFGNVGADRPRRPPHLSCKHILLLGRQRIAKAIRFNKQLQS